MYLKHLNLKAWKHPHPIIAGIVTLTLVGGGMIFLSQRRLDRVPQNTSHFNLDEERARGFLTPPFQPQAGAAGEESARPAPPEAFTVNCADCHGSQGEGGDVGPRLIGITAKPRRSTADLQKLLSGPRTFGLKAPMPDAFHLSPEERRQIIEWLGKL
ncbi:MAG TPA: cytochrome c [Blastocatellia bacterium]|nr:cytochrome c [Blastocatellia bacterium]